MRQIELSQKSPPCIVLLAVTLRGRSNMTLLDVAMTAASCHFPCSCPCISRHSQVGLRPPFFGTPLQAEQAPQEGYPEVELCSSEAKDSQQQHCQLLPGLACSLMVFRCSEQPQSGFASFHLAPLCYICLAPPCSPKSSALLCPLPHSMLSIPVAVPKPVLGSGPQLL